MTTQARTIIYVVVFCIALLGLGVGSLYMFVAPQKSPPTPRARAFPKSKTTLKGVDLADVNAHLLPQICYAGNASEARDKAFADVKNRLDPLPELQALIGDIEAAQELELGPRLEAENAAVLKWNQTLRKNNVPLKVEVPISSRLRRDGFCILAYAVLAETEVKSGEDTYRVRLGTREDNSNMVEGYLGHASKTSGEAFIAIDTTATEATGQLWPLLDTRETPPFSGIAAHFHKHVRAEAEKHLSQNTFNVLSESAWAQRAFVEVRAQVHARHKCGATLTFAHFIPARGFTDDGLNDLEQWIADGKCPNLKQEEWDRLEEASEHLREVEGLEPALHELTAMVSRNVTLHEVRHLQDHKSTLTCAKCPPWMNAQTQAELSAYIATISTTETPFIELYGQCKIGKDKDGQHSKAAAFAANHLLDEGCDSVRLPEDLQTRARALEQKLFSRASTFELPGDYPSSLRSRHH